MTYWLTSREAVKSAADVKLTARADARVDRAIEAATRTVEKGCRRANFAPTIDTRYWDWPNDQDVRAFVLELEENGLISLTSLTSGGVTITVGDVNLEPVNTGPPFTWIELDTETTASFGQGTGRQRNVAVTGLFGYTDDSAPAGTIAEALDNSEVGVQVSNSALTDVGTLLRCEDERMFVTAKGLITSGQTLGTNLGDSESNDTVNLTSGAAFNVGEVITIDSERMLLVDIAGNNGIVIRAWDGSRLASHTSTTTIYVPRSLTVERGAAGTTAASHNTATALTRWVPPKLAEEWCIALALVELEQETSAFARTTGSGDNEREARGVGLIDIAKQAKAAHGRLLRSGAV